MSLTTTSGKSGHALVIGASVAGLLAARVLAGYFERVIVLDRDKLTEGLEPRKGAPQARHTHAILKAGVDIIADLFPGIWAEMEADGSVLTDMAGDWVWFHHGVWKHRAPVGVSMYCQTRPFLESHLRRRLKRYGQVTIVEERAVTSLQHDSAARRVTGVHVKHKDGNEEALAADLVVDASGRGTRSPRWLDELGYGRPPEKEIKINLGYSSRLVQLSGSLRRDWKNMVIFPKAPHETKGGYLFPVQNNQWSVTLAGYLGDYPPADDEGFLAFARQLSRPEFHRAIEDAFPVTPIAVHRVPSSLMRCYEKMPRFPDGYAVLGDAACSMNPVFGQGMSSAAFGATALQQQLERRRSSGRLSSIGLRKAVAKSNDVVWLLAGIEDFRYPRSEGVRVPGIEMIHWYIGALLELGAVDPELNRLFIEVMSLTRPLTAVLVPSVALKVLRWSLGLGPKRPSNEMPRARRVMVPGAPAFSVEGSS